MMRLAQWLKLLKRMNMMKRVYISGQISGRDIAERKEAFKAVERELAEMGLHPVNPFENGLPDEASWEEQMRKDLTDLMQCDYIYMMRGWEMSRGATLEHLAATMVGIKVFKYE